MCQVSVECAVLLNLMMAGQEALSTAALSDDQRELMQESVHRAHHALLSTETLPRLYEIIEEGVRVAHFRGH